MENKRTGQGLTVTKRNNTYEFMAEGVGHCGSEEEPAASEAMVLPISGGAKSEDDGAARAAGSTYGPLPQGVAVDRRGSGPARGHPRAAP